MVVVVVGAAVVVRFRTVVLMVVGRAVDELGSASSL